jgi:acetolactate synthase-1/2/3 large subunit
MATVTGGQLVAEALIEKQVEYIFTLSGGHITPIYQFLEDTAVTLFDTRHEQAALFMAEAWGKLTRKPAVAMVTAGPGFTNALTGVASAYFSNTPLVLIAGCVGLDHKEKLDLQDMPQEPVIAPMVKKTFVCQKAERVPEYVDMAFRTAASGTARAGLPGISGGCAQHRHRKSRSREEGSKPWLTPNPWTWPAPNGCCR